MTHDHVGARARDGVRKGVDSRAWVTAANVGYSQGRMTCLLAWRIGDRLETGLRQGRAEGRGEECEQGEHPRSLREETWPAIGIDRELRSRPSRELLFDSTSPRGKEFQGRAVGPRPFSSGHRRSKRMAPRKPACLDGADWGPLAGTRMEPAGRARGGGPGMALESPARGDSGPRSTEAPPGPVGRDGSGGLETLPGELELGRGARRGEDGGGGG